MQLRLGWKENDVFMEAWVNSKAGVEPREIQLSFSVTQTGLGLCQVSDALICFWDKMAGVPTSLVIKVNNILMLYLGNKNFNSKKTLMSKMSAVSRKTTLVVISPIIMGCIMAQHCVVSDSSINPCA